MQNLTQFIESYSVNEHLIDSAPQMIFIMGLPASGKSTFVEKTLPKIFSFSRSGSYIGFRYSITQTSKGVSYEFRRADL